MIRHSGVALLAAAVTLWCTAMPLVIGGAEASAVTAAIGNWRAALEVPGTAAMNSGGDAVVNSVSCASAGHCVAGGVYVGASRHGQAFVVSEVNGVWGKAIRVPGSAALNAGGGNAAVDVVSCPSVGFCTATGVYADSAGHFQVFVASQIKGTWKMARPIPGLLVLNAGGRADVVALSCSSKGNCAAGGSYNDGSGRGQAFVASQVNGTWHAARQVPGTASINTGGMARIATLSCSSTGNCAGGGSYSDHAGQVQAFVVREANGTWQAATPLPGLAALNAGGNAAVSSLSCPSPGQVRGRRVLRRQLGRTAGIPGQPGRRNLAGRRGPARAGRP
jgi:hypothetical protein